MAFSPRNDNERAVVEFFAALSSGDLERLGTHFHEDSSWTPMLIGIPGAGRHEGRDKILYEFLGPVRGAFMPGDPKSHIDSMASSGDFVMVESHSTGKRADGKDYFNRYAWAIELRGGKIAHVREYMDSLYVARFFDMDLSGTST
jgi:ketosteroid isomerase-like protein